jgi:outer membrane protein assembly factor BamA
VRVLLLLLLVTIAAVAIAIGSLPEDEFVGDSVAARTFEVQSVAIDGGHGLPLATLRSVLHTQVGRTLDDAALDRDREALETALEERGYLAAHVAPPSVTYDARGGAYIVFDIDRGPMFHLRSVEVTGPGEREVGVVTIAAGDEAVRARVEHARQALLETFARRGHKADVELTQRTDFAAAAVDVVIATR